MFCLVSHGVSGSRQVAISLSVLKGTVSAVVSYDSASVLNAIDTANVPSTGATMLSIAGSGLGTHDYTPSLRLGGTVCSRSGWTSDSALQCALSAGVAGSRSVTLTSGVQVGTTTVVASYNAPSVSTISQANVPTTMSSIITVHGSDFGEFFTQALGSIGGTTAETGSWTADSALTRRQRSESRDCVALLVAGFIQQ